MTTTTTVAKMKRTKKVAIVGVAEFTVGQRVQVQSLTGDRRVRLGVVERLSGTGRLWSLEMEDGSSFRPFITSNEPGQYDGDYYGYRPVVITAVAQ
jgi:hypothetical protein